VNMRTQMAGTSLATFSSLGVRDYLQPKERELMAVFDAAPGARYTRQALAQRTGMAINAVCGRVRSLLDKHALEVHGETVCPVTRKPQELLGLPVVGQWSLF